MSPDDVILERLTLRHSGRKAPVEERWHASIGISTPISLVEHYEPQTYGEYGPTAGEAVVHLCEQLARVIGYERAQTGWPHGVPAEKADAARSQ
jgi:hypothetical protein